MRTSITPGAMHRFAAGRRQAGQALIIAVLVLFAVATLAALFTGIIGSQLTQVGRQSDLVALRNIAEAGLRLANEQLTYSPLGADWRPSAAPYTCGDGQVTVEVSYGPVPGLLQSRFMRIVSTAVFPDNPFLRHTILALKPILLTDYTRFITDRFESHRPAALGAPGLELGGAARPADYVFRVDGPLRSNTDIVWYGQSQVALHTTFESGWSNLGLLRDDRIEVAGAMFRAPNAAATDALNLLLDPLNAIPRLSIADLFSPQTAEEQDDYLDGFPYRSPEAIIPNSRAVLANLPVVTTMTDVLTPATLAVPRVRPPEIDAIHPDKDTNRYLSLTRDSGFWTQDAGGLYFNTGEYGWGWSNYGGVYVDNTDDIQYNHDLEKLRLNWTRSFGLHTNPDIPRKGDLRAVTSADPQQPPSGPADWWDQTGRYYAPPGTEIVLHGEAPCPYIEIIRHDAKSDGVNTYYWREPAGQIIPVPPEGTPLGTLSFEYTVPPNACAPVGGTQAVGIYDGSRAIFPFPANGVIYAEGNVRLRGIMPPVRDNQGRAGVNIPADEVPQGYFGAWDGSNGRSRRFDLQVVSGGTIYVEGDVLSPSTAQLAGLVADDLVEDQLYGSRLALLAKDYVCLNTTALNPRPLALFWNVADNDGDLQFYNDLQHIFPPGADLRFARFRGQQATDYTATARPALPTERTDIGYADFGYANPRFSAAWLADIPDDIRLIIGHSALYAPGDTPGPWPSDGGSVDVAIDITGTPHQWDGGASVYTFRNVATPPDESPQLYDETSDPNNYLEYLPVGGFQEMLLDGRLTGNDTLRFGARVTPVPNTDGDAWLVDPVDLNYLLGPVAIAPPNRETGTTNVPDPLPVNIDALIYAQNGSWFILPGRWFNEDPDEMTGNPPTTDYPGYHEPLNIKITVQGAITENMPADLGSVADWTSKWCGPSGAGANGYLAYSFDPLLRYPRRETEDRIGYLRFPNFPVTSDLVVWGERVSGPAGT